MRITNTGEVPLSKLSAQIKPKEVPAWLEQAPVPEVEVVKPQQVAHLQLRLFVSSLSPIGSGKPDTTIKWKEEDKMSQEAKNRRHITLIGIVFFALILAVSYVWSQININGQDNNVVDIEIQVDADEQEVDELFAEAEALNRPGTKEQSLARFKEIVLKYPNSDRLPKIYLRMGGLALQINQPEKAEKYSSPHCQDKNLTNLRWKSLGL